MSRQLRIVFPGVVHHIGARGFEKSFIFNDAKEKQHLLDIIGNASKKYGFVVHAYAVMGNHYHILGEVSGARLPAVMHYINMRYGLYYNTRHNRKGHVFERRYKALVIQKGEHMKGQVQYIHMNPIRARIEEKLGEYKWTSHNQYIGKVKNGIADRTYVLSLFGDDTKTAIPEYEAYMANSKVLGVNRIEKGIYGKAILGDDSFIKKIKLAIDNKCLPDEINCRNELKQIYSPQEVIKAVCEYYEISETVLMSNAGRWNTYKKTAIYLLNEDSGMCGADIGRIMGMHQGSASKAMSRLERKLQTDKRLLKDIGKIRCKYQGIKELAIK